MRVQIHLIDWNGMAVQIRHTQDRFGIGFDHLEIETLEPARAQLPMTETGYRSHFLHGEDVVALGGAVAYVNAWLDDAAQSAEWQEHLAQSRQLSLF